MKNKPLSIITILLLSIGATFSQSDKPLPKKTDLKINIISGNQYVSAGEKVELKVILSQLEGNNIEREVWVDFALISKKNYTIPAPLATYSPDFHEGVLLKGGRNRWVVPKTGSITKKLIGELPDKLPNGKYYLATIIDAGNAIHETNEYNNVDYFAIEVKGGATQPTDIVYKDFSDVLKKYEVYMAGKRENKGQIFVANAESNGAYGNTSPVYTSKAISASAITFSPKEEAYFVDANRTDIYRTDGDTEEKVYTHTTHINDIVFDRRNNLYFSEAMGAGADGKIYKLDLTTKRATKQWSIPLSKMDGFWAGDFAFSPDNQLYISNGNRIPASLFVCENGAFKKLFTDSENSINGFCFLNSTELIYTDELKKAYFLRNFSEKALAFEASSIDRMQDICVIDKSSSGNETITGSFENGKELWDLTYIYIYGPNLHWRTREGYSMKVPANGVFTFSHLRAGKYWVTTDIHADSPWGFRPRQQVVQCHGQVAKVVFRKE